MAILTIAQLREHIETSLGDDALQRLLNAAEEAIVARAGAPGARAILTGGGYRFISLPRPASAISSITETRYDTTTTLAVDDYDLLPDGYLIERLTTGTNPRSTWYGTVEVTFTPVADTATREMVQVDLCKLDIAANPHMRSLTIGSWTEQYANDAQWNEADEREAILARLNVSLGMVVIG